MHGQTVFTVGHSNRAFEELRATLAERDVRMLIDVRRVPRSRYNPQFNDAALRASLPAAGVDYVPMPELGGRRAPAPGGASPNGGWADDAFRAYADYALTDGFRAALDAVDRRARAAPAALMCAERDWRRCHRQIIADYLLARGRDVVHLLAPGEAEPARLTPFAEVRDGGSILYPEPPSRQAELPL